jgi:glycosyltransferase involved in cell wall biosynthesis
MLDASIIIPTYNRKNSLLDTLESLERQSHPGNRFEVVIVDDGGSDGTEAAISERGYSFILHYIRQRNQGSAVARNTGAENAQGHILIFLDDDMWLEPDYVTGLIEEHRAYPNVVGMGTELPYIPPNPTPFATLTANGSAKTNPESIFVDFTHCITNNVSIERDNFIKVGKMQDVAGDGPTWWGDVDFGYRADRAGLGFRRSGKAKCYHRDYSTQNLASTSKRYYNSARMAVLLFKKFPDIQPYLPMFDDKTPVAWGKDTPGLIVRKVARRVTSSRPALWLMEQLVKLVEQQYPSPAVLRPIYRWIVGGYIFQGYQTGLREFGRPTA